MALKLLGGNGRDESTQDDADDLRTEILVDRAKAAFEAHGVTPLCQPIRGGTDGATLSRLGLPCPNLSTGGYQFHSVREFIPVQSLHTMVAVLEDLVCSFVEKTDVS